MLSKTTTLALSSLSRATLKSRTTSPLTTPSHHPNHLAVPHITAFPTFDPAATLPLLHPASFTASETKVVKPWPYSLPKWLQPKAGTTYDVMYGRKGERGVQEPVGVLQAVLYGVPNPGKKGWGK